MGNAVDQFKGVARIRALATEARLAEHWEIEGTHAEGFECSCGYGLGDGTGDLDGRHRRHVAEALAATR